MKKVISLLVVVVFVCAGFFVFADVGRTLDETPSFLSFATMPPWITTLFFVVNIPDANLNAALHDATGVPSGDPIYNNDLYALTGNLILNNKNISNLEGIQYCSGISGLYLERNNISSLLADMSGLASLEHLSLKTNHFTSVPQAVSTIPGLTNLTMSDNPITSVHSSLALMPTLDSVRLNDCSLTSFPSPLLTSHMTYLDLTGNNLGSLPSNIGDMVSLEALGVNACGLSSLPASLFTITGLKSLAAADNNLSSLSGDVDHLTSLNSIDISGNDLQHLPNSICDIPSLNYLVADDNRLYDLPSDIGDTHISALYVSNNRISTMPSSIGSSEIFDLNFRINRLTSLPGTFDDKNYDFLNIEFNFLDVSPGSPARTLINNTTAGAFGWERQFQPVENLVATATDTEITLTWDECLGDSADGATWSVDSYIVYLHDGELEDLADLTPAQLTFTHSGLAPLESHEYWVGVTYHLVYPGPGIDMKHTAYAEIEAQTLETPVDTPTPLPSVSAPASGDEEPGSTEPVQDGPDNGEAGDEDTGQVVDLHGGSSGGGLPVWAIIVICVAGAGALGAGGFFGYKALMKARANKPAAAPKTPKPPKPPKPPKSGPSSGGGRREEL